MKMESVIANTPSHCTFVLTASTLVCLALDTYITVKILRDNERGVCTKFHDMVAANGAVINHDV